MIISKDFEIFKNILHDKKKAPILLKPPNWLYDMVMRWKKIYPVVDDIIFISFNSGRYHYKAEFVKDKETGYIKIKNSKSGAIWWSFLNSYISKRITRNWNKVS